MRRHQRADLKAECWVQLWQFWRPSAWQDGLGFYTGWKRWAAVCYPFLVALWVLQGLTALKNEIKTRGLEEPFWSGARLDLWVLAVWLVLAVPVFSFFCIRMHAADSIRSPDHTLAGEQTRMVKWLGQTLKAGHALSIYLQSSRHAQPQQIGFNAANMHHLPALSGRAGRQGSSFLSALMADIETATPVSRYGVGPTDEEASAAFDLHSTIVRNLAARLSLSARILDGIVLTEPWEVFEAFRQ